MEADQFTLEIKWLGRVAYAEALSLQEELNQKRREKKISDTVLLLEHEPVYTIGRTRDKSSLKHVQQLPHPVFEISRGGQATYHGPGQLVGYLILDLRNYGCDLHAYLQLLEKGLVASCRDLGIQAGTREGLTGVWVENRKIASIGVGVRHWVSMHGFAINVEEESRHAFQQIIPCGIQNVTMTSIEKESGKKLTVQKYSQQLTGFLREELNKTFQIFRRD